MVTYEEIAKMIDHSLLNPFLTDKDIEEGCRLAARYKVAAVSVRTVDVPLAARLMKNSDVQVGTIIGFPQGTTTTLVKVAEAEEAISSGATELDMVINIGKLKSGDLAYIRQDIQAVSDTAKKNNVIIKIIFENCYLCDEEIIAACKICSP